MGAAVEAVCRADGLSKNLIRSCSAVKGSKLVLYEDAAHGLDKEHKDELVTDIVGFCASRNLC